MVETGGRNNRSREARLEREQESAKERVKLGRRCSCLSHFLFLLSLPLLASQAFIPSSSLFFYSGRLTDDRVALPDVLARPRPCFCVVCSCPAPRLRRRFPGPSRCSFAVVVVVIDDFADDLVDVFFFSFLPLVRRRALDGAAGEGSRCQRVPLAGAGTESGRFLMPLSSSKRSKI